MLPLLFSLLPDYATSQTITQTVKGLVVDRASSGPLPGATIVIVGSNPMIGAASDIDGKFVMKNVPVGRYSIRVSFLGYETLNLDEVLVGSGKEVMLNISLEEVSTKMNEVVITAGKGRANNSMSTISARQFSVEEAARYAGGYDDPARLASSFAGVSGSLEQDWTRNHRCPTESMTSGPKAISIISLLILCRLFYQQL